MLLLLDISAWHCLSCLARFAHFLAGLCIHSSSFFRRVIRPPGGASTIFDEADAAAASANDGERNVVTPERHVNYKMRSNFELGDEQPAPPPVSAMQQQQLSGGRRRSKPSGEPLF